MALPDLLDADIVELQDGMCAGAFTSEDLVLAYSARIAEVDAVLRAVTQLAPRALEHARALDAEREGGRVRSLLHGVPIVIKDQFEVRPEDGLATTCGSVALRGTVAARDATLVARLRDAGAVILGCANLSEFGWMRSLRTLPKGWSSLAGQGRSPYNLRGTPIGSSSGSATVAAIGGAAAAIGLDTFGSIQYPSTAQMCCGLRTTSGLLSRAGACGASLAMDSVGPIARTVRDVAVVLQAVAGRDDRDELSLRQPAAVPDYLAALDGDALRGARIGLARDCVRAATDEFDRSHVLALYDEASAALTTLGAHVEEVAIADYDDIMAFDFSTPVWAEFGESLDKWLGTLDEVPSGVRSLRELVEYNKTHAEATPPTYEDQSGLEAALRMGPSSDADLQAFAAARGRAAAAIDDCLRRHSLDAVSFPLVPAMPRLWCYAGYPSLVVPFSELPEATVERPDGAAAHPAAETVMFSFKGMPVGLAFAGAAYSEARLLALGHSFEVQTRRRATRRPVPEATPTTQLADVMGRRGALASLTPSTQLADGHVKH